MVSRLDGETVEASDLLKEGPVYIGDSLMQALDTYYASRRENEVGIAMALCPDMDPKAETSGRICLVVWYVPKESGEKSSDSAEMRYHGYVTNENLIEAYKELLDSLHAKHIFNTDVQISLPLLLAPETLEYVEDRPDGLKQAILHVPVADSQRPVWERYLITVCEGDAE